VLPVATTDKVRRVAPTGRVPPSIQEGAPLTLPPTTGTPSSIPACNGGEKVATPLEVKVAVRLVEQSAAGTVSSNIGVGGTCRTFPAERGVGFTTASTAKAATETFEEETEKVLVRPETEVAGLAESLSGLLISGEGKNKRNIAILPRRGRHDDLSERGLARQTSTSPHNEQNEVKNENRIQR
jgi:hypothetical protein